MKSGTFYTRALVLFLLGLCAVSSVQAIEDRLTLYKGNEVLVGQVRKDDGNGVEIEVKNAGLRTLNPGEIADVEWDVGDKDFRTGVALYKSGTYYQAYQHLASIISEKETMDAIRVEVRPYLFYIYADSLYHAGKVVEAVAQFKKLIADYKSCRYVPMAIGSLVDAAIQRNDKAGIDEVSGLLAPLRDQGGEQKAQADYYEARLLLAKGKPKDAESKFVSAGSSTNVAEFRGLALMGQADCAIADSNIGKARDLAQKALASNPSQAVAGAAHLVVGDAIMAEVEAGKLGGDTMENKLLDALLEYMRVTEQYRGDPRTEPKALLRAGDCLKKLSGLANHSGDRQRAIVMYNRVASDSRFRNTPWASQAEDAIKSFR